MVWVCHPSASVCLSFIFFFAALTIRKFNYKKFCSSWEDSFKIDINCIIANRKVSHFTGGLKIQLNANATNALKLVLSLKAKKIHRKSFKFSFQKKLWRSKRKFSNYVLLYIGCSLERKSWTTVSIDYLHLWIRFYAILI